MTSSLPLAESTQNPTANFQTPSTIGAPPMAFTCSRFITRAINTTKIASATPRFALPTRSTASSPLRRFSISRTPSELGCVQSLMPLHSAVADARMTSCLVTSTSCRALSQVFGLSGPR